MDEQKPPENHEGPFNAFDVPGKGWRCGPYRLQDLLGAGAQGEVYSAVNDATGEQLAVKVLTRLLRESNQLTIPLLQGSVGSLEARAHARQEIEDNLKHDIDNLERDMSVYMPRLVSLRHPNLVSIIGWGRKDNYIWIAMERINAAKSLEWHIMKERRQQNLGPVSYDPSRLTTRRAATIVRDVSNAVHALHQNGLIHRDIKPANVLVDHSGRCVLTDLELVAMLEPDGFVHGFPGQFLGTPGYAAPESLVAKTGTVEVRSDVYSLGTLLYELVTLERPVRSLSNSDFVSGRYGNPPVRPELAENGRGRANSLISSIIMRCLQTRPLWRYPTAAALGKHLSQYLDGQYHRTPRFEGVRAALRWIYDFPWRAQRDPRMVAGSVVFALLLFSSWYRLVEIPAVEETKARICATDESHAIAASIASEGEAKRWLAEAKKRFRSSIHTGLSKLLMDPVISVGPGIYLWGMERRISVIEGLKQGFSSRGRQRWDEVLARLSTDPRFKGYRIEVDPDLTPLGRDPSSQLEEFALSATGSLPIGRTDGALDCNADASIVLVLLPPGRFERGQPFESLTNIDDREVKKICKANIKFDDEVLVESANICPVNIVEVDPFYISKWELTQAQYAVLNPKHRCALPAGVPRMIHGKRTLSPEISLRNPVENITWKEAQIYCHAFGLELPSESRWEYAAHGGIPGRWPNPADGYDVWPLLEQKAMNTMDQSYLDAVPTQYDRNPADEYNDGFPFHCSVDETWENPFGLGGMLGNVYEFCSDAWDELAHSGYVDQEATRPATEADENAIRGGSFMHGPGRASCTVRWRMMPGWRREFLGLRPMRRARWERVSALLESQ